MTTDSKKTYLSEVREEAERILCCGVLMADLTPSELDSIIADCPSGTLRTPFFKEVWESVCRVHAFGRRVDVYTVVDDLWARFDAGEIKERIDNVQLGNLVYYGAGGYANPVSLQFYADKLNEIERKNRLCEAYMKAASDLTTVGATVESVMAELKREVEQNALEGEEVASMTDIMDSLLAKVEAGDSARPIPTPWQNLNRVLKGGIAPGELVVLAARPGMGKTALSGCWAVEVARSIGSVLFVSCEMKDETLGARMIAREGQIDNRAFREGLGSSQVLLPKIREAANRLRNLPLRIVDSSSRVITPLAVRKLARKIKGNLSLIVIDYLQLMYPDSRHDSREREIADMSRSMKRLAVELNCPILLLSQLNRRVEETTREPQLSDLRESGAIEQDADIVIMLHADKRDLNQSSVPVKALVRKGRSSGTGVADLIFEKPFSDFRADTSDHTTREYRQYEAYEDM